MPYSVSMPITRRTVMRTLCSSGSAYPPFICPSLCPSQCPRVTELWHRSLFHLYGGNWGGLWTRPGLKQTLDGAFGKGVDKVGHEHGRERGGECGGPGGHSGG